MLELTKVSVIMNLIADTILAGRPEICVPLGTSCVPSGDCKPMDTSCLPAEMPCEPDLICTPTILP